PPARGVTDDFSCTVREAIRASQGQSMLDCPPGGAVNTIYLPAGTYTFSDGEEPLDPTSTLPISRGVPERGTVIVDLGGANRFLHQTSGSRTLGDVTVRFGSAPSPG